MSAESATSSRRLESFSDGVFAVAITLLVLDLHVSASPGHLAAALGREWPHYATYVVSFLTIGIVWLNHHAQFQRLRDADRTLMVINLVLLMIVTATPFTTGLLAEHLRSGPDAHIAAAVYTALLLAMGLAFFATYLWSAHAGLFADTVDPRHVSYLLRRNAIGVLVYVAAVPLAFLSAPASLIACGLVAVFYLHPGRPAPQD